MDYGLSQRTNFANRGRTHSTILDETNNQILASNNQPAPTSQRCFSSPNSTSQANNDIVELNISLTNSGQRANTTIENQQNRSQHNSFVRIDEVIDAKIKINEAYMAQLKSIDLKKYSFPNE